MQIGWVIGVDVSKAHLDVCALKEGRTWKQMRVENNEKGIQKLLRLAQDLGNVEWIGMEATGGYELDLATLAHSQGFRVCIENPRCIKDFARAGGSLNKTDRIDARVIAQFLVRMNPRLWEPAPERLVHLTAFTRGRQHLVTELNRLGNRLSQEMLPELLRSQLQESMALAERQIRELDEARLKLVRQDESLSQGLEGLTGIPGVGETTALTILAEAGDVSSYRSAQSYAAAAGLSPCRKESGQSRGRTRISKVGNARLRTGLFMAALVASRHNPVIREFKERLLKAGKTKMQALVACMRKLLMICYGVLKAIAQGKTPYYDGKPAPALTT